MPFLFLYSYSLRNFCLICSPHKIKCCSGMFGPSQPVFWKMVTFFVLQLLYERSHFFNNLFLAKKCIIYGNILGEIFTTIPVYPRKVLKIVCVFLANFNTYLPVPRKTSRELQNAAQRTSHRLTTC